VENILGGDGLAADAALGEGDILDDVRIEMVAHHQHVQMLVERVHRVGPRRVGRGRQHVGLAADADDVGRVAAAGALGMEGVDGAALERRDRVLDEARFVERVGVDRDRHVVPVRHRQAIIDGGGGGAPILMQLQAAGAGLDLLDQRAGQRRVTLAEEAEIHRKRF